MHSHSSQTRPPGEFEPNDADPRAVRRAIRTRAESLTRRELQTGIDRLQARESLTADEQRILAEMATAIVDGVLAGPESTLADADDCDPVTVRTAAELFDTDG